MKNKCKVFTEDCYHHPDCMKTLKEDKREEKLSKYNEVEKKFDKLGDECSKYLYSMPNPEQNKWKSFDRLWNEEMEIIRIKNYPPNFSYMHDLCLRIVSKTRQETIEQIEKTIKARLKYCQEHNGLPYCKNCGLELLDIERLK